MRVVINHLNTTFRDPVSDAERQSIHEHMTKFKGRMSCKQYMKNKQIKWGFKWWRWSCSKTGYLYEFYLYLGEKLKNRGFPKTVVLDLSKKLEKAHCMLFLTIFFNSSSFAEKLFDRVIYCLGTVGSDWKK